MLDTQETTPLLLFSCFECRDFSLAISLDKIAEIFTVASRHKWVLSVITPPGHNPPQTVLLCETCSTKHYDKELLAKAAGASA